MKETKCLSCKGSISYNEGLTSIPKWCDMKCKKDFLIGNYSLEQTKLWFAQEDKKLMASRKKVLLEIHKSGMTITEYIAFLNT